MISPKLRFQANSKLAKEHQRTMTSNEFLIAVDLAMLHYQENVLRDLPDPAAAAWKLKGATEFASTLLNFANPPLGKQRRDPDNLQPE